LSLGKLSESGAWALALLIGAAGIGGPATRAGDAKTRGVSIERRMGVCEGNPGGSSWLVNRGPASLIVTVARTDRNPAGSEVASAESSYEIGSGESIYLDCNTRRYGSTPDDRIGSRFTIVAVRDVGESIPPDEPEMLESDTTTRSQRASDVPGPTSGVGPGTGREGVAVFPLGGEIRFREQVTAQIEQRFADPAGLRLVSTNPSVPAARSNVAPRPSIAEAVRFGEVHGVPFVVTGDVTCWPRGHAKPLVRLQLIDVATGRIVAEGEEEDSPRAYADPEAAVAKAARKASRALLRNFRRSRP